jgi:hypothetical protein
MNIWVELVGYLGATVFLVNYGMNGVIRLLPRTKARTTKLFDRTGDEIAPDEVERISI